MNIKFFATLFAVLMLVSTTVSAAPASRASIVELMGHTGVQNAGPHMLTQMKKMLPGASEKLWTDFVKGVELDKLTDMMIPIYQKHLSQVDVDAMNKFYATPSGKKMLKTMPVIMQETRVSGQRWGQSIAYEFIRLQQKKSEKK